MRHFKKLFIVLSILIVISTALNVVSLAEAAVDATEGVISEGEEQTRVDGDFTEPEGNLNESDDELNEPESAFEAFIEIIKTIVGEEFLAVVSTAINIGLLILMAILKKSSKVGLTDIAKCVMARDASGNPISLASVVKKLNESANENSAELKEFKKEMRAEIEKMCATYSTQTVTHEQMQELAAATKAMLNIFHAVYSQSRTIGAATKTQEEEYYTEAMRNIAMLEAEDLKHEHTS